MGARSTTERPWLAWCEPPFGKGGGRSKSQTHQVRAPRTGPTKRPSAHTNVSPKWFRRAPTIHTPLGSAHAASNSKRAGVVVLVVPFCVAFRSVDRTDSLFESLSDLPEIPDQTSMPGPFWALHFFVLVKKLGTLSEEIASPECDTRFWHAQLHDLHPSR